MLGRYIGWVQKGRELREWIDYCSSTCLRGRFRGDERMDEGCENGRRGSLEGGRFLRGERCWV